jgi:hypothetical protein
MVQIHFTFAVVVSRVDPTSKQESQVGAYGFGVITQSALPGYGPSYALACPHGGSHQAAIPAGAGSACLADRSEPYSQYC